MAFHSAINLLRVLHVEKFHPQDQPVKNVLEIGPGPGNFARNWLRRNKGTVSYTAIESDTICHATLAGLGIKVYKGIEELPSGQSFDLVVISHVLEHTSHPEQFIRDCTRFLLPGGILFIEVPCNDHEHKNIVEPHLLFFDKHAMQLLLTKSGFRQVHLSYHGNTIADLKKGISFLDRLLNKSRNVLLGRNIIFPFSVIEPGLEEVSDPLERACVKPFKAHIEQNEPSWWLRAIAIKN